MMTSQARKMRKKRNQTICDACRKRFRITEIETRKDTIVRDHELQDALVQFFVCPHCGQKYLIAVNTESTCALIAKHAAFLKGPRTMGFEAFQKMSRYLKSLALREERIAKVIYMRQHADERFM